MIRHLALVLFAAIAPVASVAAGPTPAEDARALVQRVLDSAPAVPSVSRMELTTPGGLVRELTVSRKKLANGIDARYLEVTGPMNLKDTRYLFYDRSQRRDDQFMYLPFMRRIVRLSEQTRREPFLGSTFFVDDLLERPIDDYRYAFVGEETVGQRSCRLVEAVPLRPEAEPYGRIVAAIDPVDLVVVRAQLYAHDGSLFKVHTVDTLEKVDGYWTPRQQTMDNVHDHTTSRLTTPEVRYNAPIGDDVFREAYLGR
ncbi:MAG: outer membrane lipoprotein-sorting protein [Candidatus Binatia bacterium]